MKAMEDEWRLLQSEKIDEETIDDTDTRMQQKHPTHRGEKRRQQSAEGHEHQDKILSRQIRAFDQPGRGHSEKERDEHGRPGKTDRVQKSFVRKRIGENLAVVI